MTSLFVSYGSADRERAEAVATGLRESGYAAVFLDADPDDGIVPGRRWESELYAALRRSDATVFLMSDTSVASRWCFAEVALARSLGHPVVPVRIGGTGRLDLVSEVQEVDLTAPGGLGRLRTALREMQVGSDDTFAWDASRSPYPGLAAFGVEDAAVFYGRGAETDRLLELLHPTLGRGPGRWVCVVGPSGSGKSSLLHAGLLPRLARRPDRWLVLRPFAPGRHPTRRLAAALREAPAVDPHDPPTVDALAEELATAPHALRRRLERLAEASGVPNVLVVVDQLEELATRTGKDEQHAFVRLLDDALTDDSPLWVASTMRSEFLSADPERAQLSEVIDDTVMIGPLGRPRLPEVIVRPARRVGLEFAPGLVERIVEDTTGGDALPLLAYTLHEIADRVGRTGAAVATETDYEAVGGVVGALQRRADRLVADLSRRRHTPESVVRTLLRLATVNDDGLPGRRRLPWSAFDDDERSIVDAFVEARLLVVGRTPGAETNGSVTVAVAHEALLRQWPLLREAVDTDRDSLRRRAELGREAADWDAGGRDVSYLLHGGRLDVFDEWAERHPDELDVLERRFLSASRERAAQRLAAERRTNRLLRRLTAGLTVVALVAVGAAGLALAQQREADRQATLALSRQLAAQAAQLESTQPDLALLLNVEAVHRANALGATQAHDALVDGLDRSFHVSTRLVGHTGTVAAVAFAPDGRTVATAGEDGTTRLWTVADGREVGQLDGAPGKRPGVPLAFGSGGLLAAVNGTTVQLWDTTTRSPRGGPLLGHDAAVNTVVFSDDGSLLATASMDGTVRLWDAATGRPHGPPLVGPEQGLFTVAFSRDGSKIAAGGYDGTARTWDVTTARPGPVLTGHRGAIDAVTFSPDGATLYSASEDGTVRAWDPSTGTTRTTFSGHVGAVDAMALSPDGRQLVTGGADATVRLWDTATGRLRRPPMTGHGDQVRDVLFTRDGRTVVSGSLDGTLRLWDADTGTPQGMPLAGHTSRVSDVAVSPDGRTVASVAADGTARLWQVAETTPLARVLDRGARRVESVAVGPGDLLVTGDDDGRVRLWDLGTERPVADLPGHADRVMGVAVSSAGVVASGGLDGTVLLWDTATRRVVGPPLHIDGAVLDVAFSRDGSLVAAAGWNGTVTVWTTADGVLHHTFTGHGQPVFAVAFGSGATLVSGGYDGTVRLWDAVTGRPEGVPLVADGPVNDVAVSPDGTVVAAAGAGSAIQFWDTASGAPHGRPIVGFPVDINDIAFSPDGRTIAAADDAGLRLWDIGTGRPRGASLQTATHAYGVAFGPDGEVVVAGGDGGTTLWDLHTDVLAAQACRVANRNLTRAEWDSFLPANTPYAPTCPRP